MLTTRACTLIHALYGGVAEWLGGGLQNLIRRFDPALTPQTMKAIVLNAFGDSTNFKLANLPDPVVRLPNA